MTHKRFVSLMFSGCMKLFNAILSWSILPLYHIRVSEEGWVTLQLENTKSLNHSVH